jgi:hypothetical protein
MTVPPFCEEELWAWRIVIEKMGTDTVQSIRGETLLRFLVTIEERDAAIRDRDDHPENYHA